MAASEPRPGFTNTGPERIAQDLLRRAGVRFRTHADELPGTPDIVVDDAKVAIFVHGCYWHNHGCDHASLPPPDSDHAESIRLKQLRDARNPRLLTTRGWNTCVVWECELEQTPVRSLERMLHAIGSPAGGLTQGSFRGPDTMMRIYKSSVGLWIAFAALTSISIAGASLSALRIQDRATLDAELAGSSARLEAIRSALTESQQLESAARERLAGVQQELQPVEGRLATLLSQEHTLRQRQGTLTTEVSAAESELAAIRTSIASTRQETAGVQAAAAQARVEAESAERDAIQKQSDLASLRDQQLAIENAIRDASDAATRYRDQASVLFAELSDVRDQLNDARSQLAAVDEDLTSARSTIDEATSLRSTLPSLRDAVATATRDSEQLAGSVSQSRDELTAAREQLAEAKASATQLRGEVSNLRATLGELEAERSRLEAVITRERETAAAAIAERAALTQALVETDTRLRSTQQDLATVSASRTSLRSDVDTLANERRTLETSIATLRAERELLEQAVASERASAVQRAANETIAGQLDELSVIFSQLLKGLRDAAAPTAPGRQPTPDVSPLPAASGD